MVTITKLGMDIALSHVLPAIIRVLKLRRNIKVLKRPRTAKIITGLLKTESLYDTEHARKCFTSFDLQVLLASFPKFIFPIFESCNCYGLLCVCVCVCVCMRQHLYIFVDVFRLHPLILNNTDQTHTHTHTHTHIILATLMPNLFNTGNIYIPNKH